MPQFYKITAKSAEEADISIYGDIGESMWGEETVSASNFKKELDDIGNVSTLNISIQSPGGSVFDGLAIYNMLKRHKAKKYVTIDGLAASAASFIAMAGDKITIPSNAFFMIHRASTFAFGTADDLLKGAELLQTIDTTLVDIYAERTKLPKKKIKEMMEAETWMNGKESVENGFADEVEKEKMIAAHFNLDKYKNAPQNLMKACKTEEPEEPKAPAPAKELLNIYQQKIKNNFRRLQK